MTETETRQTPLYNFHKKHNARFVPFCGWEMPVQYTGILQEHSAVREKAGLFDVSHMGEFLIQGPQAEQYLDNLVTNKIQGIPVGKAVYSPMCELDGAVIDDLIVYKTGEEDFLVCVNAANIEKDFLWMQSEIEDYDCTIDDRSDDYALLALQGPKAESILQNFIGPAFDLSQLKRFQHHPIEWENQNIRICRTGYTGEDGFEIYTQSDAAETFANALFESANPGELHLCGLGARDSLRLEAGYPLYGHEISKEINPIEGGIGWTVKFKKEKFNGKEALQDCKEKSNHASVHYFCLDGKLIARTDQPILLNGKVVGKVLSGSKSPILNKPIGSALIEHEALTSLEELYVEIRGKKSNLQVKQPPLHQNPLHNI